MYIILYNCSYMLRQQIKRENKTKLSPRVNKLVDRSVKIIDKPPPQIPIYNIVTKGNSGSLIIVNSGVPLSNVGNNNDFYINNLTNDYYSKQGTKWILKGNMNTANVNNNYYLTNISTITTFNSIGCTIYQIDIEKFLDKASNTNLICIDLQCSVILGYVDQNNTMTTGSVDIVIKINYANDMIKLYKINYLSKILDTSLENINFGITQDTNTMYMIDLLVYGLDEKKIDWFISSKTSIVKIKSLNTVQIAETQTTALANYKASNLNQTIQSVDVTNTSSNGMEYLIELIIDINNYVYHVITSSFKGSNDLNKLDVNWTFSKTLNNYVNAFPNGIKITANIVCTSDNTYSTYVTNTNDNTSQAFRGYSVVFSKNDLSNYNWIEDTSQNN